MAGKPPRKVRTRAQLIPAQTATDPATDRVINDQSEAIQRLERRFVETEAPATGSGTDNDPVSVQTFTSSLSGVVPASGGGTVNYLRADGTWQPASGGGGGAVASVTAANASMTIAPTTGAVVADVNVFTSGVKGAAPASGGGTTNFLRADGAWTTPSGGGVTSVTAGSVALTITPTTGAVVADVSANGITNALLRQGAATSLVGRSANSTGNVADIAATADLQFPIRQSGVLGMADFPTVVFSVITGVGIYGYGTDGALVFDGVSTVLGFVPTASRYAINRDIFATNMTINSGVVVAMALFDPEVINTAPTAGRRVFCSGTLTVNGRLINNGRGGIAGVATANSGGVTCFGSTSPASGGGGGVGAGAAGGATGAHVWGAQTATAGVAALAAGVNAIGKYLGGGGGGGGTGAGGGGGLTAALNGPSNLGVQYLEALSAGVLVGTTTAFFQGGSGGGAGGGDGTRAGGGGGGPGGVMCVRARIISGSGSIEAKGGNGNTGVAGGNTGGGGGGGGGTLNIVTSTQLSTGSLILLATGVSLIYTGGTGAAGTGTGRAGGNGSDGFLFFANP